MTRAIIGPREAEAQRAELEREPQFREAILYHLEGAETANTSTLEGKLLLAHELTQIGRIAYRAQYVDVRWQNDEQKRLIATKSLTKAVEVCRHLGELPPNRLREAAQIAIRAHTLCMYMSHLEADWMQYEAPIGAGQLRWDAQLIGYDALLGSLNLEDPSAILQAKLNQLLGYRLIPEIRNGLWDSIAETLDLVRGLRPNPKSLAETIGAVANSFAFTPNTILNHMDSAFNPNSDERALATRG